MDCSHTECVFAFKTETHSAEREKKKKQDEFKPVQLDSLLNTWCLCARSCKRCEWNRDIHVVHRKPMEKQHSGIQKHILCEQNLTISVLRWVVVPKTF